MPTLTETYINDLKINKPTRTQLNNATTLSSDALYLENPEFEGGKLLATDSNGEIVESTIDPTSVGTVTDVQVDGTSVVSGGVANVVLTSYEKKTIIDTWGLFNIIYLTDGTIFSKNSAISSLIVNIPQTTYDESFMCQVDFVSSSSSITFSSNQSIKYIGDDCDSSYVFIPVTNKRYVIIFYVDSNLSIIGVVKGTSV